MERCNDSEFGTCSSINDASTPFSFKSGSFSIDASMIDPMHVQEQIRKAFQDADSNVELVRLWLTDLANEFERRFNIGEVLIDERLLKDVKIVSSRINRGLTMLGDWREDLYDLFNEALKYTEKYAEIQAKLRDIIQSREQQQQLNASYLNRSFHLAKSHISNSKMIRSYYARAVTAESKLRRVLVQFIAARDSFSRGLIRNNNDEYLDLRDLSVAVNKLGQPQTSLERVQEKIIETMANTPFRINAQSTIGNDILIKLSDSYAESQFLNAITNRPLSQPQQQQQPPPIINDITQEGLSIPQRLEWLEHSVLYTSNTSEKIDAFLNLIPDEIRLDPDTAHQIENVKNNKPDIVLQDLRAKIRDPNRVWNVMSKVNAILEHMTERDKPLYLEQFQSLLTDVQIIAQQMLDETTGDDEET
jgi:hypothetical protein